MPHEVVVTGMGALSGNGLSVSHIWDALLRGEAAHMDIDPRYHFDLARFEKSCRTRKEGPIHSVCGVPLSNEELGNHIGVTKASLYDRHQLFAFAAGMQAIADAGLTEHTIPDRFGCAAATASGGLGDLFTATEEILLQGKRPSPTAITRFLPGMVSGDLTRTYRLRGPNPTHTGVCAASAHALINAADIIKCSRADVMLVASGEASINLSGIASFCSTGVVSNKTRPYQKERLGFHKGEGGAALILEEYEHAQKRGATIYARIVGYGETNDGDASASIISPRIDGGMRSAQLAIAMAGITARSVGYVNTHGTGTELGDIAELAGVNAWTETGHAPLVSSTKSYSGHLFGAAGAYEAILTIMMLKHQLFLPTHGLTRENLDPRCDLPGIQHLYSIASRKIDHAISNSFGFGGTNATIVFERV
jgi:3-oxoacyl-[acyl-carrier-protein] synthase II